MLLGEKTDVLGKNPRMGTEAEGIELRVTLLTTVSNGTKIIISDILFWFCPDPRTQIKCLHRLTFGVTTVRPTSEICTVL